MKSSTLYAIPFQDDAVIAPLELATFPFFAGLDAATLADTARRIERCEYRAGEFIMLEGERPTGLFFLERGRVRLSRTAPDGREQVLAMLEHGTHFQAVPLFDEHSNPATVRAMSAVRCLLLPRDGLFELIDRHPRLSLAMLREMSSQLRELVVLVEDLAFRSVRERLARQLLRESPGNQAEVTQQELAERTGTVREIAGRALRQLAQEGLVQLERGRVRILDRGGLAIIADEQR